MNTDPKHHLDQIALIAGRAVLRAGGFSNGYLTRLDGEVAARENYLTNNLKVETPSTKDMVVKDVEILGRAIGQEVQEYMRTHKIEHINFESKHDEHGCYVIHVNYVISGVRINLWNIEETMRNEKS